MDVPETCINRDLALTFQSSLVERAAHVDWRAEMGRSLVWYLPTSVPKDLGRPVGGFELVVQADIWTLPPSTAFSYLMQQRNNDEGSS